MKKFFTFIAAVLFAGGMMAEGLLFEQTYPGTPSSKTNGYEASFTLPTGDYTLTYANINNGSKNDSWDAVRAGRKSAASVATVTTEAIAAKVSKVVINFTQVDASKTNELCLLVANNAAFTDATKVPATIAKGEVSFTVAAPAENMYYQISMDMVAHGSANGFNRWDKIQFITPEGGTPIVAPTYDTLTVAQAKEIAQALADKATSKEKYYVEGYAVNVAAYSTQYGNQIFFMVDDVNAPDSLFEAYAAYPAKDGKAYPVLAGDKVRAFGALKKYGTQLEIDHPTVEFITEVAGDRTIEQPAEVEAEVITVAKALELGTALESGKTTAEYYDVQGYVTALTDSKGVANADGGWAAYKNQCMWIADTKDGGTAKETAFFVYQGAASEQVTKGAKISIKCQIKNYNGMIENAVAKTAVTILEKGENPTPATLDTINVAKALEIGAALEAGKSSDSVYVIKGYVSSIVTKYDATNENETFWMADSKESTAASNADGAFEVYRGKIDIKEEIGTGAFVCVTAKVYKYQPKSGDPIIETSNNPIPAVHVIEKGVIVTPDTVTVAQALEIGQGLGDGAVSTKEYVIKGYVSDIQDYYTEQYGNETFWITDTKGDRTSDKTKAFEVYRGKPSTGKEIGLDALIQITCKIKNYKGTIENDGSNVPFEVLEQGKPVVVDTVSVAKALEIGQALADNAYTDNPYVVIGYVTKAFEPDSGKTQQNFYMADDPDVRGDFYAYKASPDSKISQGDYVELFGKIQKYVGSKGTTIELSYGSAKHLEAPKVDTLTVAEVQALDLAEGATTEERYVVIGYVAAITSDFEEDLQSFNLSDDAAATVGEFICIDAVIAEPGANLHDQVKIVGKIQKLNGAFRMVSGKAAVLTPQGIENVVLTEKAQKVLVDGVIYIIRDNKIFNLQGTQVR